jgi:RNA polymerase sigma-70 factor (ECF subfamily)
MPIEDKQHVERLKDGSYDDFTILYNRHAQKLYGFVFGLIRSHTTTKDIVQETFVKVWEKRADLRPDLSFQSFLFMIARNKLLNEIRNQTGNKQFLDYLEIADTTAYSENETYKKIDYDEFVQKLNEAKAKLSPRQLEIFKLNKEEGFSITEISVKLSITEPTVSNQLSIALRTVRDSIGKNMFLIFFF